MSQIKFDHIDSWIRLEEAAQAVLALSESLGESGQDILSGQIQSHIRSLRHEALKLLVHEEYPHENFSEVMEGMWPCVLDGTAINELEERQVRKVQRAEFKSRVFGKAMEVPDEAR
jgi:hypothetical protein